jgi:polysaccharide pyruvyl transferase WcaK-like protein
MIEDTEIRIALLTPYSGGNLGDAAIQDAMIANLRSRLPGVQFSGISLNSDNFLQRHASRAFPLCVSQRPFYGMARSKPAPQPVAPKTPLTRSAVKKIPGVKSAILLWHELRHCVGGYRFLRQHDLLIVSGGGQLDEEWGGAWGHPFALFKWTVLARLARVPVAFASVGACKTKSGMARFFLKHALRKAHYRSYREKNSRELVVKFFPRASEDDLVPDIAFSLPLSEMPQLADIRSRANGSKIVAISPIAYAKPGTWPHEDQRLYERYLAQMEEILLQLLKGGYFVVLVWSSRADKSVITELLNGLRNEAKEAASTRLYVPPIENWEDLVAALREVDVLIASRLHSTILGFVAQTPTIAISFDPKVDWVMEDLGQTEYLFHIHDVAAQAVIAALEKIDLQKIAASKISDYLQEIRSISVQQYDRLARLASGETQL